MTPTKPRILTGDTPTGRLHLGHYVGSVENRLAMQDQYDCYFIIANKHAFTTRADQPADIRQSVVEIATDYLAAGIDPNKSTMFIQSEVPAIDELTFFFSMLIPFNRVMRNPTLKDEIRDKGLGENYPFGFPLYAVGQCADILAFRPALVPVGEDQLPHLELTREVARKFDQVYCGVNPQTEDKNYLNAGGLFPIIEPKLAHTPSWYWRQHCFATFMTDPAGLRLLDMIGPETVMWASDYPHQESTLGYSSSAIQAVFDATDVATAQQIVGKTALDLFRMR